MFPDGWKDDIDNLFLNLKHKFFSNSPEFEILLDSLDRLKLIRNQKITKNNFNEIDHIYDYVIWSCNNYLEKHKGYRFSDLGKKRKSIIEKLQKTVGKEKESIKILDSQNIKESDNFEIKGDEKKDLNITGIFNIMTSDQYKKRYKGKNTKIMSLLDYSHRFASAGEKKILKAVLLAIEKECTEGVADSVLKSQCILMREYLNSNKKTSKNSKFKKFGSAMEIIEGKTDKDYVEDNIAEGFNDYTHLSAEEAKNISEKNEYNHGKYRDNLYGDRPNTPGFKTGYILTDNSNSINSYLRGEKDISKESKDTIKLLDKASKSNLLPRKIRLHRMLGASYLKYALNINLEKNDVIPQNAVTQINKQAGKTLKDSGFMCTGYKVDTMFASCPVMLTLLCDEGTPAFVTDNHAEGEIILGRNTSYMILGAKFHKNAKFFPLSNMGNETGFLGSYKGLEIFAKVIKK